MGLERFNTNSKNARKTIFCDIDGTLVKFPESFEDFKQLPKCKIKMKLLPGTLDKLWDWETAGRLKALVDRAHRTRHRSAWAPTATGRPRTGHL